jgi:hypothetical protein
LAIASRELLLEAAQLAAFEGKESEFRKKPQGTVCEPSIVTAAESPGPRVAQDLSA